MAILQQHFYHNTISLYTSIFGSIFSNLKILRDDGKEILVPLAYAAQQRYNVRAEQTQNEDESLLKFMRRTPRMSFILTNFSRDSARVKNKYHQIRGNIGDIDARDVRTQYNRVPHEFNYRLDITTKYLNDMLQILEQILVSFNPSIQVVVKDNPDLAQESSVTITLNSNSLEDSFEGIYDTGRTITASLDFTLEGYLYMPTSNSSLIRKVIINYHDLQSPDELLERDEFGEQDVLPKDKLKHLDKD